MLSSREKIRQYTENGWWGSSTLYDVFQHNASSAPEQVAVVDPPNKREFMQTDPECMTFRELETYIDSLTGTLDSVGIMAQDVLVVQLPNTLELVAVLLACARMGVVVSPLPMQYGKHELAHVVTVLQPKVILTTNCYKGERFAAKALEVSDQSTSVRHVLVLSGQNLADLLTESHWRLESDHEPDPGKRGLSHSVDANQVFSVCWTSGTEAAPKGVPRTHNHWLALGKGVVENVGIQQGETLLNPFPMVNAAGIGSLLLPWLLTGGKLIQHQPFDPRLFVDQIEAEGVNYTAAAPAVLNTLLKDASLSAEKRLSTLRRIGCGAAPLSPWMVKEFERRYRIPVINILGSNEGILLISSPRDITDPAVRAQVFPRFGVKNIAWQSATSQWMETKLVDPQGGGEVTSLGVPGEVIIKGPMVFEGYIDNADLNARVFDREGFFHTGDLLEIVEVDGKPNGYRFVGRLKEIIIRGGVNISPEEIEELIIGHPKVKEVAVVGYPDDVLGEKACAVVVPVAGMKPSLEEINAYLSDRDIARYKHPERLMLLEELPRNALGKVVRREITLSKRQSDSKPGIL